MSTMKISTSTEKLYFNAKITALIDLAKHIGLRRQGSNSLVILYKINKAQLITFFFNNFV